MQPVERQLEVAHLGDGEGGVAGLGQPGEHGPHLLSGLQVELFGIELQPVLVGLDLLLLDAEQHVMGPGVALFRVVDVVRCRDGDGEIPRGLDQHGVHPSLLGQAVILDLQVEAARIEQVPVPSDDVSSPAFLAGQQQSGRL